jgi:hypothetical protein
MKKDGGSGRDPTPYEKPEGTPGRQGAVYTVAGSSGQISGGTLNHPAMFISLNVLGSVVLDFQDNRLDASFLNSSGVVQDTYAIVKSAPTPPATTDWPRCHAGNNQVSLTWNASAGASTYTVKRATISGGPYTPIATAISFTSYTDTTAVNGTTYYYVVTAQNSQGESANSTEASATPQAPAAPAAPTNLTVNRGGKKKLVLNWTQSASPNITQKQNLSLHDFRRTLRAGGDDSRRDWLPKQRPHQRCELLLCRDGREQRQSREPGFEPGQWRAAVINATNLRNRETCWGRRFASTASNPGRSRISRSVVECAGAPALSQSRVHAVQSIPYLHFEFLTLHFQNHRHPLFQTSNRL